MYICSFLKQVSRSLFRLKVSFFYLCSCLQSQVVSMETKKLPIIVRLLWCQGEMIPNVSNRVKDIVQVNSVFQSTFIPMITICD